MTITIRDIAKKLNLSIAAVSRALGGYSDISEETRSVLSTLQVPFTISAPACFKDNSMET
jgi:hypothetical protein